MLSVDSLVSCTVKWFPKQAVPEQKFLDDEYVAICNRGITRTRLVDNSLD